MRWNFGMVLFVALAAAYFLLGLYGKYRKLMEDFHEARAERAVLVRSTEDDSQGLPRHENTVKGHGT